MNHSLYPDIGIHITIIQGRLFYHPYVFALYNDVNNIIFPWQIGFAYDIGLHDTTKTKQWNALFEEQNGIRYMACTLIAMAKEYFSLFGHKFES